ncbi:molybdenum cofactor synthesis domain-containing protein [Paracoccus isoporae]|uniref:Molybdenum cofactor synthesis domain-containing protein n=1 Tax=Paracoccus isoporae TaxID=591205 RepID=A0A1G7E0Z6_9RHOB|nr:molybdopterin-binding protein [Paracoccus isoporae]SDE57393.1 molybdenum cofactor synthesis domain-containing protein [Paracoccus isoporae]
MQSDNKTAAILVIGDEILSGRTREGNAHHLAGVLNAVGIDLKEIRVVADEKPLIIEAIHALDSSVGGRYDLLFTSGGIGPTHDDVTADAVAEAFGVGIEMNDEALAAMRARWEQRGVAVTGNRLRMARIPLGAELIPNKFSAAPGFHIGQTYVMAGVPEVFRAMVDAVLPTLPVGRAPFSESLDLDRGESDVADDLKAVADSYADLSLGSYPWHRDGSYGTMLVIRGLDGARVAAAMAELKQRIGA